MHLLTETEVSGLLNCTKSALRRWRLEGSGPTFVRVGRLIRYDESDLTEYVEQHKQKPRTANKSQRIQ